MLRKVYQLTVQVPAGSTSVLSQPMEGEGRLEKLRLRVYAGNQLSTKIYPRVVAGNGQARSLVEYASGASSFVAGDDDTFDLAPDEPVSLDRGDVLQVTLDNTAALNPHWVNVHAEVVYFAGGVVRG